MTEAIATCGTCGAGIGPRTTRDGRPTRVPRYCSSACRQRAYRRRVRDAVPRAGLPVPVDEFVGREAELAELVPLLRASRLLTLVGPVGVGKTRLGMALATAAQRAHRDGARLVQLGPCASEESVLHTVGAVIGAPESAAPALAASLAGQDLLLVLDNCEHVLGACAELVGMLLSHCPGLRVLATSREILRSPGEVVYRVGGLAVPGPSARPSAAELLRCDAVRLFVSRARAAAPGFELTADNAAQVSEVCTRLDGMPLAIELATRLARLLPVTEIVARLNDQLGLLTGGHRTSPARHGSLRAAIEWSYQLLSTTEQAAFRRLSLLQGGFGIDGANAICAGEEIAADDVLELVVSLEGKSLLTSVPRPDRARFRMLEAVRLFGREQLLAHGEHAAYRQQLVDWLTELALSLFDSTALTAEALRTLEDEFDNFASACASLAGSTDERQLVLLAAMECVRWELSTTGDGGAALQRALAATDFASRYRSVALDPAARHATRRGDHPLALRLMSEAIELERGHDRPGLLSRLLRGFGYAACVGGHAEVAVTAFGEAARLARRLGDDLGVATAEHQLAWCGVATGDLTAAEQLLAELLPRLHALAAPRQLSAGLATAGEVALRRDDLPTAERRFARALRAAPDYPRLVAISVAGMGVVAARRRRFDHALRLITAASALNPAAVAEPWWRELVTPAETTARNALPAAKAAAATLAGAALTIAQAVDHALRADARPNSAACPLSPRERETARLVATGSTNRTISGKLGISLRTVETTVANMRAKLGLPSRVQLAVWAAEHQRTCGRCGVTS